MIIGGVSYLEEVRAGVMLERYDDGTVRQGFLADTTEIAGLPLSCEVAFWPSGALRLGYSEATASLGSLGISGYVHLRENGELAFARLVDDTEIGGVVFKGGSYVDFHPGGTIAAGRAADRGKIGGVAFAAGDYLTLARDGSAKVVAISNQHTWTTTRDDTRYECSLFNGEFCCGGIPGGSSGRFAEWGTSCPIREFMFGQNQEFVTAYCPDAIDEVAVAAWALYLSLAAVDTAPIRPTFTQARRP